MQQSTNVQSISMLSARLPESCNLAEWLGKHDDEVEYTHGIVQGHLDYGMLYSKNQCYLQSKLTGRNARCSYSEQLRPRMIHSMGQEVQIWGNLIYEDGKLVDIYAFTCITLEELKKKY